MKIVVHDASILIDLALSKTVEAWFAGGVETWTTDLIYPAEIGRPDQQALFGAYAAAGKLQVRALSPQELEELLVLRPKLSPGLSLADLSALKLARMMGPDAILATGDRLLRATAEKEKVQACGILKLFDIMVDGMPGCSPVLPPSVAIEKLRALMLHPECRLPAEPCAQRIKAWSQTRPK
jgi:hypothetical protein